MKNILNAIMGWMLAHPVVEHLLMSLLMAVVMATYGVVQMGMTDAKTSLTWGIISAAVLMAVKTWYGLNKTLILAQIQDAVQNIVPATTGAPPAPTQSAALTPAVKVGLFLMGFLFLASTANAGYLMPTSKDKMSLSLPSGTAIYLMPIEGFQVGVGLPNPTYGLSLSEDVVWGDMASVNGVPNFAPILGAGLSLYADAAGVINGTGPLLFLGGFNAVGPDLDLLGLGSGQGLVPNVLLTENFVSGETKITGGLTAFVDLGPGTAKKLF